MPKVLFAQKVAPPVLKIVEAVAEPVFVTENDQAQLEELLQQVDAVIAGTWVKFTKELIDKAPRLKVISRTGVGVDSVDVEYASEKGIMVLNTPTANSISVAEHTTAMVGALAKSFAYLHKSVVEGNFSARRQYLPCDIAGKTVGLIGCGNIGQMAADKCRKAYDMNVVGYDPYIQNLPDSIMACSSMEDVFKKADFISLHIPLSENTRHIVGEKLLGLMKPNAYLINTSRGGIVDEQALYRALKEKSIAGAGLDVFEQEPLPADSPLCKLDNILLTPHSAALTKECTLRVAEFAAQGVADYFTGKQPQFIYNKAAIQV